MSIPRLRAEEGIDRDVQAHCRLIPSVLQTSGLHTHDFYELFLIVKGSVIHCVNGKRQPLVENTLVFVRDTDAHHYEQAGDGDCQFINLSFYRETLDALLLYLGEDEPRRMLLAPSLPPSVRLSDRDGSHLRHRIEGLGLAHAADKRLARMQVRALLAELISLHILPALPAPPACLGPNPPVWLTLLCAETRRKRLYLEGVPALLRLSGRSHAYLCRSFKSYLGVSPVAYVNELRLEYASELLSTTGADIADICLEIGFENMSHFYGLFKRKYKQTPRAWRLRHRSL